MALHVIASPKGAAISFSMGLLRRSAPRNDGLFISFVLSNIQNWKKYWRQKLEIEKFI